MGTGQVIVRTLASASLLSTLGAAQAVLPLQGRDINGNPVDAYAATAVMEYDPNLNITWLRDWNYANTTHSSFANVVGGMTWNTANAWASNLTVGIFGGWSLPGVNAGDTACSTTLGSGARIGYNCTGGPMGYMYYTELGNLAGAGMLNKGPFQNVQSDFYWSATEYAPNTNYGWYFSTYNGYQTVYTKLNPTYAVAVRPGDVAAAVPEVQTWALMSAGLGLMGLVLSRRKTTMRG